MNVYTDRVDGYEVTVAVTDATYYLYVKRNFWVESEAKRTNIYFFNQNSPSHRENDWEPIVMPSNAYVLETARQHVPVLKLK